VIHQVFVAYCKHLGVENISQQVGEFILKYTGKMKYSLLTDTQLKRLYMIAKKYQEQMIRDGVLKEKIIYD